MNWLLLFLILILCFYNYYINRKDITYPSVLISGSFLLSSFFLALNSVKWDYSISWHTLLIICSSLCVFSWGCSWGECIGRKKEGSVPFFKSVINSFVTTYNIPNIIVLISILVGIAAILVRLRYLYDVVGSINIFTQDTILGEFRKTKDSSKYTLLIALLSPMMEAIGLVFSTLTLDCFVKKLPIKKIWLLPVVCYVINYALSSSRLGILCLCGAIVIIYLLIQRNTLNKKLSLKQIYLIFFMCIVMFTSFWFLGLLTGKTQHQISFWDNISKYAGSSLVLLDYLLNTFHYSISNFGTYTLKGLNHAFLWLGLDPGKIGTVDTAFYTLGNMGYSNVSSCLYGLVYDYNYWGMYFIMFVEGILSSLIHRKAKVNLTKGDFKWLVFYAYVSELLLFSAIAERIIYTILTISTLIFVISVLLLNRFVVKTTITKNSIPYIKRSLQ